MVYTANLSVNLPQYERWYDIDIVIYFAFDDVIRRYFSVKNAIIGKSSHMETWSYRPHEDAY